MENVFSKVSGKLVKGENQDLAAHETISGNIRDSIGEIVVTKEGG